MKSGEENTSMEPSVARPRRSRWGLVLLVSILFLGLAAVAWHFATADNEPLYQGRPLRDWSKDLGGEDRQTSRMALSEFSKIAFLIPSPSWQKAMRWPVIGRLVEERWKSVKLKQRHRLVKDLISLLSDQNPDVRSGAGRALESFRQETQQIIPAVFEHLHDTNQPMRLWAVRNLALMKSDPRQAVPALIHALDDPDKNVRGYAIIGLGNLGTNAVEAVPALSRDALKNSKTEGRRVKMTLEKIAPKADPPVVR